MKQLLGKNGIQIGFLLLAILLVTVPFLLNAPHARPQFDDFGVWLVMNKYSFWEAQVYWYQQLTGRFAAMSIMALFNPMVYRNMAMLFPLVVVFHIGFLMTLYWSVKSLLKGQSHLSILSVSALLSLLLMWNLPSPAEAFYWVPSLFSYQLGFILSVICLTLIWKRPNLEIANRKFILPAILCLITPATSEVNLLLLLAGIGLTWLIRFFIKRKPDSALSLLLLIALIASAISVLAPGNNARAQMITEAVGQTQAGNLAFTLSASLSIVKAYLLGVLMRSPFLPISLLIMLAVWGSPWKPTLKPIHILILGGIWFGLFWLLHMPFIYKAGIVFIPGRVQNIAHYLFTIGWVFLLIAITGVLSKSSTIPPNLKQSAFGVLGLFVLVQLLMPNKIQSAINDYRSGKSASFSRMVDARDAAWANAKGQVVRTGIMKEPPYTIYINDLDADSTKDQNTAVANYYGLKSVRADSTMGILQ